MGADLFPVRQLAWVIRLKEVNAHFIASATRKGAPGALPACFFTQPSDIAAFITKIEQDGLDHDRLWRGGQCLKKRRLKRQKAKAVRRCPFREEGDGPIFRNRLPDDIDLIRNLMLAGAIDEDGFVLRSEPADDRPFAHAILRDKGCACDSAQNGDVVPRQMVGNEEHIVAQSRAMNFDPRTQNSCDNAQIEHRPWRR